MLSPLEEQAIRTQKELYEKMKSTYFGLINLNKRAAELSIGDQSSRDRNYLVISQELLRHKKEAEKIVTGYNAFVPEHEQRKREIQVENVQAVLLGTQRFVDLQFRKL